MEPGAEAAAAPLLSGVRPQALTHTVVRSEPTVTQIAMEKLFALSPVFNHPSRATSLGGSMELRSPETSLARLLPGCPISQSPSWFARKTPDGSDPTVPPRLGSEGGRPVTDRYHRLKRVVLTLEGVSVAVCREATLRAERVGQIWWTAIQVFSDVRVPSSLRIGRMSVSSRGECAERVCGETLGTERVVSPAQARLWNHRAWAAFPASPPWALGFVGSRMHGLCGEEGGPSWLSWPGVRPSVFVKLPLGWGRRRLLRVRGGLDPAREG